MVLFALYSVDELLVKQSEVQRSVLNPSSHVSFPFKIPSPQFVEHTDGNPEQTHPSSTWHDLHPSFSWSLASSHTSFWSYSPSPHGSIQI